MVRREASLQCDSESPPPVAFPLGDGIVRYAKIRARMATGLVRNSTPLARGSSDGFVAHRAEDPRGCEGHLSAGHHVL